MKLKGLHFELFIPLFGQQLILILGYDCKRAVSILERYQPSEQIREELVRDQERDYVGFTCYDYMASQYLVYMPELPSSASIDGTLTHELFHVAEHVLFQVGIKYEINVSNEVFAYLLGWLKAEVSSIIWKAMQRNY